MTFTEAALKVLEHEGRPLHSREIAERAVEWGLLSHVGKTPVQTMSGCLSASVAKGAGKTPFARVSPGVFGLAEWKGRPPGPRRGEPPRPEKKRPATTPVAATGPAGRGADSGPKPRPKPKPKPKPKPEPEAGGEERAAGGEGGGGREEASPEVAESASKRRKRKRRRKRPDETEGGRPKGTEETEGTPASTVPPVPPVPAAPSPPPAGKRRSAASMADLADRAEEILRAGTKPIPLARLCDALGTPGGAAAALLDALLTADGIEREQRGMRPRFIEHRGGWALAEREVSAEIIGLERQATEASERLSRLAERQVLRRLRSLPQDVLARVVVIFLRRFGFGEMRAVDRGRGEELHLSVQDRRRGGRFRTAVVVRRDAVDNPVTDADVAALRGALHHYEAMSALVITTGVIDERARAEAEVPNLAPVALVDGEILARELVRHGIGVRERRVTLPAFDDAFFVTLAE